MATVNLKLFKQRARKDGTYPVILEIFYNGRRKRFNTGVFCLVDQWNNDENNIIVKKHPGGKAVYIKLFKLKIEYEEKITMATLNGQSAAGLFNNIDGSGLMLFEFVNTIVTELNKGGKKGNAIAYYTLLEQLKKKSENVLLCNVDYNYINAFKFHKLADGNKPNTIIFYLKTLKAVINEAIRRGYYDQKKYPFTKGLMPKPEATPKRFLTAENITTLENCTTASTSQKRALDCFLLGYYLRGADIIDLAHLTKDNISRGRIEYRRKKSGQILSIKIIPKAADIISRYSGNNFLLPILDKPIDENRKRYYGQRLSINQNLKRLGVKLEIPIKLTTKVNRHSWATIAKFKGVGKDVIKEALGHQDRTITDVYLGSYDLAVLDAANDLVCNP